MKGCRSNSVVRDEAFYRNLMKVDLLDSGLFAFTYTVQKGTFPGSSMR